MSYKTKQIKGKGRGKFLGYPTINLKIPPVFKEEDGIYAAWVGIAEKKYKGAVHYGPVPTFHEKEKSFEVFLLDAEEKDLAGLKEIIIEIELVKKIRDILEFTNPDDLSSQIGEDVKEVEKILRGV